MLTRCGIDPQDYFSGEDFAHIYDFKLRRSIPYFPTFGASGASRLGRR